MIAFQNNFFFFKKKEKGNQKPQTKHHSPKVHEKQEITKARIGKT